MSANITVADRLAERLRTSELGTLLSDEDTYDLCKQAIQTAFFKDRTTGTGYNSSTKEPLLIEIARASFLQAMTAKVKEVAAELAKQPEFGELMQRAVMNVVMQNGNAFGGVIVQHALMAAGGVTTEQVAAATRRAFGGQ